MDRCKHWLLAGTCALCNPRSPRVDKARGESQAADALSAVCAKVTLTVPVHARRQAEKDYARLTSGEGLPDECLYYGNPSMKWAVSGRITFEATPEWVDEHIPDRYELYHVGTEPRAPGLATSWQINNTDLAWKLIERGARV